MGRESRYMRRSATQAPEHGRMNLRNCGRTETLYNAVQSADIGAVLEALEMVRYLDRSVS